MRSLFNEGTATELNTRSLSLAEDTPAVWGTMIAGQMICHCPDAVREALGIRPTPSAARLLTTTIVKWIFIYLLNWPKGKLPTSTDYDQHKSGTCPTDFNTDRLELLRLLSTLQSQPVWFKFHAHPLFGRLSRKEWGTFLWKHLDHHLRQFNA